MTKRSRRTGGFVAMAFRRTIKRISVRPPDKKIRPPTYPCDTPNGAPDNTLYVNTVYYNSCTRLLRPSPVNYPVVSTVRRFTIGTIDRQRINYYIINRVPRQEDNVITSGTNCAAGGTVSSLKFPIPVRARVDYRDRECCRIEWDSDFISRISSNACVSRLYGGGSWPAFRGTPMFRGLGISVLLRF